MSVTYRLTLAGEIPVKRVAECAIPDLPERAGQPDSPDRLSVGLYEQRGFWLSVRSGRAGYYDAADDDGERWEWKPAAYVNVTFALSKDDPTDRGTSNMIGAVARVLAGLPEDAALLLNGDVLLLTRVDGALRKHNRTTWWSHYQFANQLIPD